jgi:hypothetical protein
MKRYTTRIILGFVISLMLVTFSGQAKAVEAQHLPPPSFENQHPARINTYFATYTPYDSDLRYAAKKHGTLPNNATAGNYSWSSFAIEFEHGCPEGQEFCDTDWASSLQAGLLTAKDGLHWFVFAEPDHEVTCVRGQKAWSSQFGGSGCLGEKSQPGLWYGFDLRVDWERANVPPYEYDTWVVRLVDNKRKPTVEPSGRILARVKLAEHSVYNIVGARSIFGVTKLGVRGYFYQQRPYWVYGPYSTFVNLWPSTEEGGDAC